MSEMREDSVHGGGGSSSREQVPQDVLQVRGLLQTSGQVSGASLCVGLGAVAIAAGCLLLHWLARATYTMFVCTYIHIV